MKILAEEKVRLLAEARSWSLEYASGYIEGETQRRRATSPTPFMLVGMDQYSLGFRAGYFDRQQAARSVRAPVQTREFSRVA